MSANVEPKLTPEEVRRRRVELDRQVYALEKRHRAEVDEMLSKQRALHKLCPHENMNGGSYSRWCTDCGRDWDTT